MTDTRNRLLDAAESSMRERGYHAVSFRDLAEMLQIKSASVHYHFRQKEDLGVALVQRYQERFFEALSLKVGSGGTGADNIAAFCAIYRASLVNSQHLCLCAMLGAESKGLPAEVAKAVNNFFTSNIDWLQQQMQESESPIRAQTMLATLQGAMMLANSIGDHAVFDSAVQCLLNDYGQH